MRMMEIIREVTSKWSQKYISPERKYSIKRKLSALKDFGRAVFSNWASIFSLCILALFVFMAFFGPLLAPYDPHATHYASTGDPKILESPSFYHPFGTTHLGEDLLSQWMHGTRVSIFVGLAAGFAVMIIGTNVGLIAGYYKGSVDNVLMRIVDILYGIPALPLVLIFALFFGATVLNIFIAFILVLWRNMSRVIRAQTLSISERPFVTAARATGMSDLRIMYAHILPNLMPIILIETVLVVSTAIIFEAGASFLGVGAEDSISWGTMLQMTFDTGAIRTAWWWVIPPGVSIMLVVLALFYLARAIEKITNPEVDRFG